MKLEMTENEVRKLFSPWILLLCLTGLLLNLLISKLVIFFSLPLYLDNIGSILTAALGGALPGMAVGFLSNALGSLSEPISLYYAILTVIIAWLSSIFSQRGLFKSVKGWLLASGCFILIGGAVGSVMTWFLYGGGLGGIAEPYARVLYDHGFSTFLAQFTADVLLDIPDKLLTVGAVCLILKHYPKGLYDRFPLSYLYDRPFAVSVRESLTPKLTKRSVNRRMVSVVTLSVILTSITAVMVSSIYHHQRLMDSYKLMAESFSEQAAACIDNDQVERYLAEGRAAEGYSETEQRLYSIYDNNDKLAYLYVYAIRPEGCYVVFDLDTPDLKGNPAGTLLTQEQGITDHLELFLQGGPVPSGYSNDQYGTLITAFTPLVDTAGKTVAYACVDINIDNYFIDMMTYIIQVVSILFAVALLIAAFTLWYVNRYIATPIRLIVSQSKALDAISPEKWLDSDVWRNRIPIKTGDEMEELYQTVCKVEENVSRNVRKLIETEQRLLQTRELERVNQELAMTIQKADEANRAKTEFLSRMSHDIRTPLNAILGTASLAKDELNDPAAMEEALEVITTSGRFLLGLINDILDINKIESGKIELRPEPYGVDEFISTVQNTFLPLMERKHISFVFDMRCGHGVILADKLRYNQIFFNLLSNAIKYTPEGGKVEFIAEALNASEGIAGIHNIVRDNGIGISQEYMQHIFEPFTRDPNAAINQTEGSGLGLAIVKNIVDAMGGSITVNSELGKGTEFVVDLYLPLTELKEPAPNQTLRRDEELLRGKHILLVEDNDINIRIARKLLEKKGCIVTEARDGRAAVELFSNGPKHCFDLILMDIRMPVMDGLEAARSIRKLEEMGGADVPMIAMTANAYEEDVKQSLTAGMDAHLAKPIDSEKLYQTMCRCLNGRRE